MAGNVLTLITVRGIVPVSGICLSVCLQRRGRYVMLRITFLLLLVGNVFIFSTNFIILYT